MRRSRRGRFIVGLFAGLLLQCKTSGAIEGPSFDCSQGVRQSLAVILCNNAEAAQADWDLSAAYWALFTDDKESSTFNKSVSQRCTLPVVETPADKAGRFVAEQFARRLLGAGLSIPPRSGITGDHVGCVINALRERARTIRAKLAGDALVESKLSPEEHIEIQQALTAWGFLQNQNKDYGAKADGQFGPNTRAGIKEYQRSLGARPTGFLSTEQRVSLLETPERREAKARAEELARQEAMDRERRRLEAEAALERARNQALEAKMQAEARARQEAADRERRRLEAEAQARQEAADREKRLIVNRRAILPPLAG